jgi:uncharacterized protein (UPF0335 family)
MTDNVAGEQLRQHIEAIETINEEIKDKQDDRKDRYSIAKSDGFAPKVMKAVIQRRAIEREALQEHDAVLQTYEEALA